MHLRKKYAFLLLFLFFLIGSVFLHRFYTQNQWQTKFNEFTQSVFINEVQADSITLHYTLSHPEKYNITNYTPSLGSYSEENQLEDLMYRENILLFLENFPISYLTQEQKLTYDILQYSLHLSQELAPYALYQTELSPTTGIQAQLPILFAEYSFYSEEDLVHYLKLLPCTSNLFQALIQKEQEKAAKGLFMSDTCVDAIITQCEAFVSEPKKNYLISIFNDKLAQIPSLSEQERLHYQTQNRETILRSVIPAYQYLIRELTALKGSGKNDAGLYYLKDGTKYYSLLVKRSTGSEESIPELEQLLMKGLTDSLHQMKALAQKESSLLKNSDASLSAFSDESEILHYLQSAVLSDFPAIDIPNVQIKYVHPSLEKHLSPAFFLTPTIDSSDTLSIYVNPSVSYSFESLFTTLAHEGYPGHLYQSIYFKQQKQPPLRQLLSFRGYSEGWATYAELYSYSCLGLSDKQSAFSALNKKASLCLFALVDIGIHYHGWKLSEVCDFFAQYGLPSGTAETMSIFQTFIEEPGNYLPYTIGYLQLEQLRDTTKDRLGEDFSLKKFHTAILQIGPAPFSILETYLAMWKF